MHVIIAKPLSVYTQQIIICLRNNKKHRFLILATIDFNPWIKELEYILCHNVISPTSITRMGYLLIS